MRVILYTGKGGVGKTTVAAATAVACAAKGHKTLVVSTDAAHSLADSLDTEVGDTPTAVAPNLWAQEVNALHEMEDHWERIHKYILALMDSWGVDDFVAEEMATPPGMEEIASLMWIKRHKAEGQFDVVIVDCAPTGETLQLLAFPEVARWYLTKLFPLERKMWKVARPVVARVGPFKGIPLPTDDLFGHVHDLLLDLDGMKNILGDPKTCTVRLVLNLEKMVVKEAQRAFTYLSLYDYLTDLVVVNRVLPPEVHDNYFASWRASQERYDKLVDEAFSPVPIKRTRLFDHEIVGLENLAQMAASLYGDEDPSAHFHRAVPQKLKKLGSSYELQLQLPFVGKEEVDITRRDSELFVTVGPYKREISLPRILSSKPVRQGKLEDGYLRITFGAKS